LSISPGSFPGSWNFTWHFTYYYTSERKGSYISQCLWTECKHVQGIT